MASVLIRYAFSQPKVANPDGSFPAAFTGVSVRPGPGDTVLGSFDRALALGSAGKAAVKLTGLPADFQRFCVAIVFQAAGPIGGRQTLVASDLLPFALSIEQGDAADEVVLVGSVTPAKPGWSGLASRFKQKLKVGRWYTGAFAYDNDTAALFVDGEIIGVHAFPNGKIKKPGGSTLSLGTATDGSGHFRGMLAAFQWWNGIPDELEAQLDERRSHAEWFVAYKEEAVRPKALLGEPQGALAYDAAIGAHVQQYQKGAIMYHDSVGAAFEMHGPIHNAYKSMAGRAKLGYLVSDEVATTRAGGRKSVFSAGAIYWSGQTGAMPVLDQIYLHYEHLGESQALGFPTKAAATVPGGLEQEFQSGRIYYRAGSPKAHAVRPPILTKYLTTGGVRAWGFPTSDELPVVRRTGAGATTLGRQVEFEGCTIYWSQTTGAFEVHGDIRRKYQELNGPLGDLGFPTSDEMSIPGVSGAGRMNTFQNGSLLWYGSFSSIVVARPFRLFLGRLDTRESEGLFMGQNDLYCFVKVTDGGTTVYNKRHPSSGDWGGRNIKDVNLNIPVTLVPNNAGKTITFTVDVWDADPGNDDHLGKYVKQLNAANGWGLRENNGVHNSGSFAKIRAITWSVKPIVDPKSLSEREKWWGVRNQGTPSITWRQHASAFRDVDSETEWWDVTDWLDKAFYELVTESIADAGNCFGMSLEAIYARRNASLLGLPLDRFTNWEAVRNEFNIKHCYQVGASAIWWFLGQFITGNTHDPKDVFTRTREEFNKGNHPVLCVAQNYDFSGAPHCVLPVAWDSTSKPWRITIADPNFPATSSSHLRTLTVNPDNNTFEYVGSSAYRGGEWSGGRLHYMPFSLLCQSPRTPLWDAILLLLAGTIIILAEGAETDGLTDEDGNDLNAFGTRATRQLQSGRHLEEYFVGFRGFDRIRTTTVRPSVVSPLVQSRRPVAGEILLRTEQLFAQSRDPGTFGITHLPIGALLADRRIAALAETLRAQPAIRRTIDRRAVHHVVNDPAAVAALPAAVAKALRELTRVNARRNFVHGIKGTRAGNLGYVLKHGLSEFRVLSPLAAGEKHRLGVKDLGTSRAAVRMTSEKSKTAKLEFATKLGVKNDYLRVAIDRIPVGPNRDLDVNVKPGLGGLEMVGVPAEWNAPVTIEASVEGKRIRRRFSVKAEQGLRMRPEAALWDNAMTVSRIDRLFGPAISTDLIRGQD